MISVISRGSDKPVCNGGAKVRNGYPRSITIISTFYYGLLRSVAVSCVLTKAKTRFFGLSRSATDETYTPYNIKHMFSFCIRISRLK